MVTPAQLMMNLFHFFSTYKLSLLKLFFYGLKTAFFRLSITALLASFGSDGGHCRLFLKSERNQPRRGQFRVLTHLVGFRLFRHVPSCNEVGA